MNTIFSIRRRLDLSQSAFAAGINVTQGNVSFYEKGQSVPPKVAARLIDFCRVRGLDIGYDHIYGAAELPPLDGAPPVPHPTPTQEAA